MNHSRFKLSVAILVFIFGSIGCTKIDTTTIGKDLIPAVDNVHTFDTVLTVNAKNFLDADVCDSVGRGELRALGIIADDPAFGQTAANIFVEFKPQGYPLTLPEYDENKLFVDSAVIVLQYVHTFGDTNSTQRVLVHPVTENMKRDSAYTTCQEPQYGVTLLGEKTFVPATLKDSLPVDSIKTVNQLRIPIQKQLIETWFANAKTNFASDSAFTAIQKGFALIADESFGGNGISYFDLTSAGTRLAIYLRSQKGEELDTFAVDLRMTSASATANSIKRNYVGAEILDHVGTAATNETIYLQTAPGNWATLQIPALENLSNRVIHRAELLMEQSYSLEDKDDVFGVPARLFLDYKDTSGRYVPIPCDFDAQTTQNQFAYLGGKSQRKEVDGQKIYQYTFNISRYVQSIVTRDQPNLELRLSAPYYITNTKTYVDRCQNVISPFVYGFNFIANGRVKLHGTNSTPNRMRLRIIYSNLD